MKVFGENIFTINGYNGYIGKQRVKNILGENDNLILGLGHKSISTWGKNSIQLDGTGDYIRVPDHSTISLVNNHSSGPYSGTFACWFKLDGASTQDVGFFSKGKTADSDLEYRMFLTGGKFYFDIHTDVVSNYRRIVTDPYPHSQNWQHVCFVHNAESSAPQAIYLNGVPAPLENTGSGGSFTGINKESSDLWIGAMENDSNFDLDGNIAHVMMWQDRALTMKEVEYIYGRPGNGPIIHYNPMVDSPMYNSSAYLKIWLPCQSSSGWQLPQGGTTYTGPPNYYQPTTDANHPGGELMNNAQLQENQSPQNPT